jgi:hypothetical protein
LGADSRLVELCRPIAYNVDTELPPHTFRNGDPARIEEIVPEKKKKKEEGAGVDGVVYRVSCPTPGKLTTGGAGQDRRGGERGGRRAARAAQAVSSEV